MKVYTHPDYSYVKVVEIPFEEVQNIDIDICEQPRETLGHYYNRMERKPEVLINAGFFALANGTGCFTLIDDQVVDLLHAETKYGIGTIVGDTANLVYGAADDGQNWHDFIGGYPVLVKEGVPISTVSMSTEINYNALRSCIGYSAKNIYVVAVSKPGMRFVPLAKLMAGLGCLYAINLDGGGSSRLLVNGEVTNTPTENRKVDSVLAIYLKSEKEKKEEVESAPYIEYIVKSGDSMWKIATYYYGAGSKYKQILEFNNLTSSVLRVGQSLRIPLDCEKYTVVKGDSLWKIAANKMGSGLKYKELAEFNNINPNKPISVGQIIFIPV